MEEKTESKDTFFPNEVEPEEEGVPMPGPIPGPLPFPYNLRPDVRCFAREMERVLRMNDYKGGWHDCSPEELMNKFSEEVREVVNCAKILFSIEKESDLITALGGRKMMILLRDHFRKELVDAANVCMMLADNFGNLPTHDMLVMEDREWEKSQAEKPDKGEDQIYIDSDLSKIIQQWAAKYRREAKKRNGFASNEETVVCMYADKLATLELELKHKEAEDGSTTTERDGE